MYNIKKGKILISVPSLDDDTFFKSVVLPAPRKPESTVTGSFSFMIKVSFQKDFLVRAAY